MTDPNQQYPGGGSNEEPWKTPPLGSEWPYAGYEQPSNPAPQPGWNTPLQPPYGSAPQYPAQQPYGNAPQYPAQQPYGGQPQYPGQLQYPGQQVYAPQSSPVNGLGIAGFVCGLLSLVIFCVPFVSVLLAVAGGALSAVGMTKEPKSLAIAGLVMSVLGLLLTLLWWTFLRAIF